MRFFIEKRLSYQFSFMEIQLMKKKWGFLDMLLHTYIQTYIQGWFYRSLSVFNRGPIKGTRMSELDLVERGERHELDVRLRCHLSLRDSERRAEVEARLQHRLRGHM